MMRRLNKKGSILLYVIFLLIIMGMIAVAMLTVTVNNTKQSAFVETYEQTYYDAESLHSVASAVLKSKLDTLIPLFGICSRNDLNKEDAEKNAKENLENKYETSVDQIIADVKTELVNKFSFTIDTITGEIDGIVFDKKLIEGTDITYVVLEADSANVLCFYGKPETAFTSDLDGEELKIEPAVPFYIKLTATVKNRSLSAEYPVMISGAKYKEATKGSDVHVVPPERILDSYNNGSTFNNTGPDITYKYSDGSTKTFTQIFGDYNNTGSGSEFPNNGLDKPENQVQISYEINLINNKINGPSGLFNDPNVKVLNVVGDDRTVRPSDLIPGSYNAINQVGSDGAKLTLVGDFSSVPLVAVKATGYIIFGSDTESFICNRTGLTEPLYVYAPKPSNPSLINFTKGCYIANAKIAIGSSIDLKGTSTEYIYCDANIYTTNSIYITGLNVSNWDVKGVPTFISGSYIKVSVVAPGGFSGIFNVVGGETIDFDLTAPTYNGALLSKYIDADIYAANPIMYCELNPDAYKNLPDKLKTFFNATNSGVSAPAEYIYSSIAVSGEAATIRGANP